jgi:hypothetical protein
MKFAVTERDGLHDVIEEGRPRASQFDITADELFEKKRHSVVFHERFGENRPFETDELPQLFVHLGEEVAVITKPGESVPFMETPDGVLTHAVPITASTS